MGTARESAPEEKEAGADVSVMLANGGATDRRALDYYPTPPDVTAALCAFLALPAGTKVWEPACGNGMMVQALAAAGLSVVGTDIQQGDDYLLTAPPPGTAAIITNPPFRLAEEFIRKSVAEAPLAAMLLKSQYWHAARRRVLFQDLPPAFVLPLSWRPDFYFGAKAGAPTMEVLWTVWQRGVTDTRYRILGRPSTRFVLDKNA